jgi:hypothetical protein
MPVTPANRSITHPLDVPGKDPLAHNLDNNVYAAQTPSPTPPAKAEHDIESQHEYEKNKLDHEKAEAEARDEKDEKKEAAKEHDDKAKAAKTETAKETSREEERAAAHSAPATPESALNFAIIDIQRGINQIRQSSAASVVGTWAHTAILYFDAAIARLDWSLDRARSGKRVSAEQRAAERVEYEKNYRDEVPNEVPRPSPLLDKLDPNATVR